jgi:transposase
VLTPEVEIITDDGRRRRWMATEELRIVEGTLDERACVSNIRAIGEKSARVHRDRRVPDTTFAPIGTSMTGHPRTAAPR